jgi:hypothetical protein
MAQVRVFYDQFGKIVTVVEMKSDSKTPPAGLLPMDGIASLDARLKTDETVLTVHTGYRVDSSAKQPKLVSIPKRQKESK